MSHYRDGKGQLPGPCPAGQGVNHRSFARQLLTLALDDSATGEEAIASAGTPASAPAGPAASCRTASP